MTDIMKGDLPTLRIVDRKIYETEVKAGYSDDLVSGGKQAQGSRPGKHDSCR